MFYLFEVMTETFLFWKLMALYLNSTFLNRLSMLLPLETRRLSLFISSMPYFSSPPLPNLVFHVNLMA